MSQTRQKKKMTPEMVKELLELREQGWSFPKLGIKFGIDHTTAVYHAQKAKLKKPEFLIKEEKVLPAIKSSEKELLPPEKINSGKNYMDYIKEKAEKEGRTINYYLYAVPRTKEGRKHRK